MKEIKFVIVGHGRIGGRHREIIEGHPNGRLVAIVDPVDNGTDIRQLSNLESFIRSGIVADVAIISTPNNLHSRQAIMALKAGMHVVIEKPMGLNRAECEAVIHTSLHVSRQVFVVKQNRYSPPAQWLKEIIRSNLMGKIRMVQINCYWNRDKRYYLPPSWKGTENQDGGVLFTQFSHFVDIFYWIFGDIKNIQGHVENFAEITEFPDSGIIQFEMEQGGIGSIQFSTAVWQRNMESSITVIGEKGSLKIGGQYMNKVEYCNIKDYEAPVLEKTATPNIYAGYQGSAGNHFKVLDNVINTLNGKAKITTNAMEGLKVVDIIERMYCSVKKT